MLRTPPVQGLGYDNAFESQKNRTVTFNYVSDFE